MECRMTATSPHITNRLSTYVQTSSPQIVSSPHPSLTVRFDHCFLKSLGILFSPYASSPKTHKLVKPINL